jgi:hypothetical protein
MKNAFSFATFTAAAFSFAVFLTIFQSGANLPEYGSSRSASAARQLSAHSAGCRLRGPLLAEIRGAIDVLSRLHDV